MESLSIIITLRKHQLIQRSIAVHESSLGSRRVGQFTRFPRVVDMQVSSRLISPLTRVGWVTNKLINEEIFNINNFKLKGKL